MIELVPLCTALVEVSPPLAVGNGPLGGRSVSSIHTVTDECAREVAAEMGGTSCATLADAAGSRDPGYRISTLDAETGRLRAHLVELSAVVEAREDAAARARLGDLGIWMAGTEAARAPRG